MLQMTTLQNIETSLKQLPQPLQIEVLHYIEFLKSNYANQINVNATSAPVSDRQPRIAGQDKGKIFIAPDFNAPLPDEILADFLG